MSVSLEPRHLRRYRDIARLLLRHGRSDWVRNVGLEDLADPSAPDPRPADDQDREGAEQLAHDLEEMGPTFVKLGQLLSTRTDLLPDAYLAALSRLQDDLGGFPYSEVERIVEEELGRPVHAVFASFDPVPLAAASLGQVHKAQLPDGRTVAVKIQRPGIEEQIVDDLDALGEMARFIDAHSETGRRLGLDSLLNEFRRAMLGELDYRREAANLDQMREALVNLPRLMVPRPVHDASSRRVLTMEMVEGERVEVGAPRLTREEASGLARDLFAAYLRQILVEGFFHADPHPGNILLSHDGRLAIIDLGMVARLTEEARDQLTKLLLGVADNRADLVADAALALGERRDDVEVDEEGFRRKIEMLVGEWSQASLSEVSGGRLLGAIVSAAGESGVRPGPEMAMLARAVLNLEQVAKLLDPDLDPTEVIRSQMATVLRDRMASAFSPATALAAAVELRDIARKLPSRLNRALDRLTSGELTVKVDGIDQRELIAGIQRLANRVTMGLVIAALIVGAAMLMRVPTSAQLFGYPALGIVCFLIAFGFGVALLTTIVLGDRKR